MSSQCIKPRCLCWRSLRSTIPPIDSSLRIPVKKHKQVSEPYIVGREVEIAELCGLWKITASGRGQLSIVSGEAGVGKSHLVLNWADYVSNQGGLVLIGKCYEFEYPLPYQAIIRMLQAARNLLSYTNLSPAHRALLTRIAPEVMGAIVIPDMIVPSSETEYRAQLFEALLQAFLSLSKSQPVLMLFEDIHWASESTLDWLTYVSPNLEDSPLLIAITYRTGEVKKNHALSRLQRRLARESSISVLELKPLSREANRELVAQLSSLENEKVTPFADRLYEETGGNPFFLNEVIRGLIEAGKIVMENGKWSESFLDDALSIPVVLPDSLRETINARVARLSDVAETFLSCSASAGRVFEYEVIQHAGGWSEETALESLEELLAHGFIRQEKEGLFTFAHHLIQECIYAQMTSPRRRYWHQRIGAAIEQLFPNDENWFGDLAFHFFRGKTWETSTGYAEQVARQAEARYADEQAIRYYEMTLDALDKSGTTGVRRKFTLLSHLLRVEERQGDYERMLTTLSEMELISRASDDAVTLTRSLLDRGRFLRMVGPIPEAITLLEECSQLAEDLGQQELLAPVLVERSQAYFTQLREKEALADIERGLAFYREGDFLSEPARKISLSSALRAE